MECAAKFDDRGCLHLRCSTRKDAQIVKDADQPAKAESRVALSQLRTSSVIRPKGRE
jgi:hypothetical protein